MEHDLMSSDSDGCVNWDNGISNTIISETKHAINNNNSYLLFQTKDGDDDDDDCQHSSVNTIITRYGDLNDLSMCSMDDTHSDCDSMITNTNLCETSFDSEIEFYKPHHHQNQTSLIKDIINDSDDHMEIIQSDNDSDEYVKYENQVASDIFSGNEMETDHQDYPIHASNTVPFTKTEPTPVIIQAPLQQPAYSPNIQIKHENSICASTTSTCTSTSTSVSTTTAPKTRTAQTALKTRTIQTATKTITKEIKTFNKSSICSTPKAMNAVVHSSNNVSSSSSPPTPSASCSKEFWTAERERALTRALIGYSDVYGNVDDVIDEIAYALQSFKKEATNLGRREITILARKRIIERLQEGDTEAKNFVKFHQPPGIYDVHVHQHQQQKEQKQQHQQLKHTNTSHTNDSNIENKNNDTSAKNTDEKFPIRFEIVNRRPRLIGLNGNKLKELYAQDIVDELKRYVKSVSDNQISFRETLRKIAVTIYEKDGGLMTKRCLSEYLRTQEFGTGPQKELYLEKYLSASSATANIMAATTTTNTFLTLSKKDKIITTTNKNNAASYGAR